MLPPQQLNHLPWIQLKVSQLKTQQKTEAFTWREGRGLLFLPWLPSLCFHEIGYCVISLFIIPFLLVLFLFC